MVPFLPRLFRFRHDKTFGIAFGLTAFLMALAARLALDPHLPPGYPYLTFFPAVILTTFVAGLWPGILAATLGGGAAWYFFIAPTSSYALTPATVLTLGFYTGVVGVDIAVIHVMNVALERLAAERNRSAALTRQARTMFSELQHRVSNNLQIVSALITLQQADVKDPAARRALEEAAARVATLGRLHRKLHNPTGRQTDMAQFLNDLCHDVIDSSGAKRIACTVEAAEFDIPQDKLIPLALIVAELVSNSIEHGFADGRAGTVWVSLRAGADNGHVALTVADDGHGLPQGFDPDRRDSLGLQVVQALAAQMDGRFSMGNGNSAGGNGTGTTSTLTFHI